MVRTMIRGLYSRREFFVMDPSSRWLMTCICLLVFGSAATVVAESRPAGRWTPLFNGRNLDGFYTYVDRAGRNTDPDHVFQVHDGVIHIYKDQADGTPVKSGYFATEANYSFYRLRFQYKWGSKKFAPRTKTKRDAGLMYHVTEPDIVFPRCIECQVQEADTGDCFVVRGTQIQTAIIPKPVQKAQYQCRSIHGGGVETTVDSLRSARLIKEGTYEVDGWNTVEVIVHGDKETVHIVNGHPVFHANKLAKLADDRKTWEPLSSGHIAFQAEFAEVFYRNIEIQAIAGVPLQPSAIENAAPVKAAAPVTPAATTKPSARIQ